MILSKKRKLTICKQIYIRDIFNKFHKNLLYTNERKVTDKKQVIAIGLSIGSRKCQNLEITKSILKRLDIEEILSLLKKKELIKIIKEKDNEVINFKNEPKKTIYRKFLNKEELINILYLLLKN